MKKFLSVLLALSVAFTFTFGATMSAFAYDYATADANSLLDYAYSQAKAASYKIDYDGKYSAQTDVNGNALDDITTFTVDAKYVQKGIDAAYTDNIATATATNLVGVVLTGDYTVANASKSKDAFDVKNAFEAIADNATYAAIIEKAAFDDYKAALTAMVNSVDLSNYTTTKKDTPYLAADGNEYYTAAEAAKADKDCALAAIAKAKYAAGGTDSASTIAAWETSYENLYAEIFGAGGVITVKENNDYALKDSVVTSVYYVLSNTTYATTKSEAADEANEAVTKAAARAAVTKAVTTYENNNTLKADAQAQLDAYKEAKLYIIDNSTTYATTYTITAVTAAGVDGVDYVARAAAAAKVDTDFAAAKNAAAVQGWTYDQKTADTMLVTAKINAYNGAAYTVYQGESNVTPATKAAAKKDYSEVTAVAEATYGADTYAWNGTTYYAKEWDAVKAAVDAYNAAVDAATVTQDLTDATNAYNTAIAATKIADVAAVNSTMGSADTTAVATYFTSVKANYNMDKSPAENIYVTWNGADYVTTVSNADANVIGWYITKGARTTAEATALYTEACAVINAYKTATAMQADADAVKAQIAALPATVALTDKDAIVAAYDAYVALDGTFAKYVTNYATLKADIQAVENLEANAIKTAYAALPAVAKVTTADKAAIKAVIDAYNAYADTTAYKAAGIVKNCSYDFTAYETAIKNADAAAVKEAYDALNLLYANDKLTAENGDAAAALKAAIAAYIDEYKAMPAGVNELTAAKIVSAVEALVAAATPVYTDTDAKAAMFDMTYTLTKKKVTSKKYKVTAKAGATQLAELKDNGYTVKYRFYKKAPKKTSYKLMKTTTTKYYSYAKLTKGKNYFKVKMTVYNAEGKAVGSKTKTTSVTIK